MEKVKNILKTLTDLLIKQFITFVASNGLFMIWGGILYLFFSFCYEDDRVSKYVAATYLKSNYAFIPLIAYIIMFSRNKISIQPVIAVIILTYYYVFSEFLYPKSINEELISTILRAILFLFLHSIVLYFSKKINFLSIKQKLLEFKNKTKLNKFTINTVNIIWKIIIITAIGLLSLIIGAFFYIIIITEKAYWSLIIIFILLLSKKKLSIQNFILAFMVIGLSAIVAHPENGLLYPYITPFICTFIILATYYYLDKARISNKAKEL